MGNTLLASIGALGDLCYISCVTKFLREYFPNDMITWTCFDIYRDFMEGQKYVDNYLAWPLVPGLSRQQQEIQRWEEIKAYGYENFDKVIRLQYWPEWMKLGGKHIWDEKDDRTIYDHQLLLACEDEPSLSEIKDRRMVFEYSERDNQRAKNFLLANKLAEENEIILGPPDYINVKPFICIAPFANTVGNQLTINDYKILSGHWPIVYFGGLNNQEIPWAIDGRGTSFGTMVAIAEKSCGIIGLESGPTYLMSTRFNVPLVVTRNPYSFPLHKQGLIKCGFRTENIKEVIVTKDTDKKEMFEEIIEWIKGASK